MTWQSTKIGGSHKTLQDGTMLLIVPPKHRHPREWTCEIRHPYKASEVSYHRTHQAAQMYASGVSGDWQGVLNFDPGQP